MGSFFKILLSFLVLLEGLLLFSPKGLPWQSGVYGLFQIILEASLLASGLRRCKTFALQTIFATATLVLLTLQITHFFLVRTMDATLGYLFRYFFSGSFSHFVVALEALHLNKRMWLTIGALFVSLPFIGWALAKWSRPGGGKKKVLGAAMIALLGLELVFYPSWDLASYERFVHCLPIPFTFLKPKGMTVFLKHRLKDASCFKELKLNPIEKKPNLYFFIIESLRDDFLNEKTAPNLVQFGKDHHRFERSFANANATHLSWFAMLHGRSPLYWVDADGDAAGICALKELGYQIHVYTSSDLKYYGMEKRLFKETKKIVDTSELAIEPWEKDAHLFQQAILDLKEQTATASFFFLESTHSEYSFPPELSTHFLPISPRINYLTFSLKDIEKIQNRYRTSIFYLDSLLGNFFNVLKQKNLFEEALVIITGDHGEEFLEEGALFHGTHLNKEQTAVPILFKSGSQKFSKQTDLATHIDLFPTILHTLTLQNNFEAIFSGQSLFVPRLHDERIAFMQNVSKRPFEFLIEKNGMKQVFRLPKNVPLSEIQQVEALESGFIPCSKKKIFSE